jgi:hypothetical protein
VTVARRLAVLEALVEETPEVLSPEDEALTVEALRRLAAGKRPSPKQDAALTSWLSRPRTDALGPFSKLTIDELRVLAKAGRGSAPEATRSLDRVAAWL